MTFANKIMITLTLIGIILGSTLTGLGVYISLAQIHITQQQGHITQLLSEANIVPYTGFCKYIWYHIGGYNQSYTIVNIGKSPGNATISYNYTGFSYLSLSQNDTVKDYERQTYPNETTIQIIPGTPFTFRIQGSVFPSIGNWSRLQYSLKIKTNGGTFGTDFNNCYVITCSYVNVTPTRYLVGNNVAFLQVKANSINVNYPNGFNGWNTSTNTTWKQVPLASCT